MKNTLLVGSLAAVVVAGVLASVALQGHKRVNGTQTKVALVAPTTTATPDLVPTAMCDYSVPSVAAQARAIAQTVPPSGTDRGLQTVNATRDWVVSHVSFAEQTQPFPADVTLRAKVGNDASEAILIAAMLRADGVPAQVQLVPVSDVAGYFGTSMPMRYVVMASVNSQSVELDTPYQHRNPQPLTDSGTLPW